MPEVVQPGDVLDGKYVVERVLGSGGMGMVVSARHVDLGQRVAVKFMLREAMHDPSNVDRFKREARAAVQLKSVHTARVIDVGQLRNGEPYMVMEYLEGKDLDELLRDVGVLVPNVAVDYMLQASEAIAEAHALGMIHRDIKLKNLFLTRSVDGRPLVKVLDFGLAKNIGAKTDVSLTATTAVFGSPQYMSPEQMRSAKDADTRSDVWSVGVCLYELLTGQLPFDAPGVAEICAMVLKDAVPPPTRIRPDLPMQLEAVVMRALEKDPSRRFQSIAEFAMALEPFAFEGSGRRILAVMETASRPQIQTMVRMGPLPTSEEIVKTISSWDSGAAPGSTTRASTRLVGAALGVALALAILAVGAVGYKVFVNSRTSAASAPAASDTPTPIAEPAPTATATAAVAAPTIVSTVIAPTPPPTPAPESSALATKAGAAKLPKHGTVNVKPPTTATSKPPVAPSKPPPASTSKAMDDP